MNPWQMLQQIKLELQNVAWLVGSAEVVFGARGVNAFSGTPTEEQIPPGFPWALVSVASGTPDEDHPELIEQQFTVVVAAEVSGDPMGEFAVIGGSVEELGKSAGRGVEEITERARAAVQNLTGVDGGKILLSATGSLGTATLGRGKHLAMAEMTLTALCTSQLHYAAPQELDLSATASSGFHPWEGTQCGDRFDFLQYRVVSKSGSSPSTGPSDGTSVTTVGVPTASFSTVAETTYTIFAEYNARGGAAAEGNSEPLLGSYRYVQFP